MAFIRYSGRPNIGYRRKKASTAFEVGDLVYADGNGVVQPADSTSGNHIGIVMKKVASTDSDYAENTKIMLDIPKDDDEFLVDVGTGTLTTAMVDNYYDLKDENEIDVNATSKKVVLVTDFVSSTKAVVKINAMASNKSVETT